MNVKFKKLMFTGFAMVMMAMAVLNPMNAFATKYSKSKNVIVKNNIAQIKISSTATFDTSQKDTSKMWTYTTPIATLYSGTGTNVYAIHNGISNYYVDGIWQGNLGVQGVCSTNGMTFYSNSTSIIWSFNPNNTSKGVY